MQITLAHFCNDEVQKHNASQQDDEGPCDPEEVCLEWVQVFDADKFKITKWIPQNNEDIP